jgi:hypothetical protein
MTHRCWPWWVNATVELASAITISAGIVLIGWSMSNLNHDELVFKESRALGDGLWFCFNGVFGNGCWR